jgi:hypothetical protein
VGQPRMITGDSKIINGGAIIDHVQSFPMQDEPETEVPRRVHAAGE